MGLGYTSDGDSEDSATKSKPVKSEPAQSQDPHKVPSSGSDADQRDLKHEPSRDPSTSPSTAAGGWIKQEEEDNKPVVPAKPFVKGQR